MYEADELSMAQAIVDSIDTSLLVLDEDLRVVSASRSYYRTFNVNRADTEGRHVADLGDGEWDNVALRDLLATVLAKHRQLEGFEMNLQTAGRALRVMRVGAREMTAQAHPLMLMEITDVTAARAAEQDAKERAQRNAMLLDEMSHRFANSLMIIASILLMRARTSRSEEARVSLQDAHQRVIAIASVQKQLRTLVETDEVELGPYLAQLCESLTAAMVDERAKILLDVEIGAVTTSSGHAVHIGLLVTELVINALKHGYPRGTKNGHVTVSYDAASPGWTLTVADNGIGNAAVVPNLKSGLGTLIVDALARRLDAKVSIVADGRGRSTSISHAA
jgi:chemotaxis protein methyltransferase CheR